MGSIHAVNDSNQPRRRFERARDKKMTRARIEQDLGNEPDAVPSFGMKTIAGRDRQRRASQKTDRLKPVLVSESDADLPILTESGRTVMIVDGQFDRDPAVTSLKPETVQVKRGQQPNERVVQATRKPPKQVAPLGK